MRYKTPKNLEKAALLIVEKGFDQDTAVAVAPKFFDMVKPGTPPVEYFIGLLKPPASMPQSFRMKNWRSTTNQSRMEDNHEQQ